jgi:hypothetical protein
MEPFFVEMIILTVALAMIIPVVIGIFYMMVVIIHEFIAKLKGS